MSSAGAAVLFPDGEIRYGIYHGTSDVMNSALFATIDEAWDSWRDDRQRDRKTWPRVRGLWEDGDATEEWFVTIYSDYGGGFYWAGRATKDNITDGLQPYGMEHPYKPEYSEPPRDMYRGAPDWLVWEHPFAPVESLPSEPTKGELK